MKYLIMLCLSCVLYNTGIKAQTKEIKQEEKVLKNTIKDKKEDKHEAAKDLGHVRIKSSLKGRREVRHHRRSIHRQGRHLEAQGVKHPIRKAKEQAKDEKVIQKANN